MNKSFNAILFDLDDTLIETHPMFARKILSVKEIINNHVKGDEKEIFNYVNESILGTYNIAKVNPNKVWRMTTDKLKAKYILPDEVVEECLNQFHEVYRTVPELREGAVELLEMCKSKGIQMGLVSHAFKRWIRFKLKVTGLDKYFTHIEAVSTNRFKTGKDWLKAVEHMNLDIAKTYVIGDNVKGDIIETYNAGFRNLIWVNREDGWKAYRTGDLPEGVISVDSLTQVTKLLFS